MGEVKPEWHGDEFLRRVEEASRIGINWTMGACVVDAKATHPFTYRTGMAERSIRIVTPARTNKGVSFGSWGSTVVKYFKYLEFGTRSTKTRTSITQRRLIMRTGIFKRPDNAGAPPWKGGSYAPTLRPTADRIYPRLAGFIRKAYAGLG